MEWMLVEFKSDNERRSIIRHCRAVRAHGVPFARSDASYLDEAGSTTRKNADVDQAGRDDTGEA